MCYVQKSQQSSEGLPNLVLPSDNFSAIKGSQLHVWIILAIWGWSLGRKASGKGKKLSRAYPLKLPFSPEEQISVVCSDRL